MSESKDELKARNSKANNEEAGEEDKKAKLEQIKKEEEEMRKNASGTFGLDVIQISELMGSYKERTEELEDLKLIEKLGGPEGIMSKLKTDPKRGIDSIDNRENDFGSNKVFVEEPPTFCEFVCEALDDLMIKILIVAAIVQIVLGVTLGDNPSQDWADGFSIVIAVIVVTLVGSITNYNKENKFRELNSVQNEGTKYNVIRNGVPSEMKSDDILVGDLINLMVGDIFPADIMLVESHGMKVDESSLTGESDNLSKEAYEDCINKTEKRLKCPSPLLLSGTHCVEGTGYGIALAVGDNSQKGIIKRTVDNAQENSKTPLEEKLESIAENIGLFGMAAGIVTLVALVIRFIVVYVKDSKAYSKSSAKKDIFTSFLFNFPETVSDHSIKNSANRTLTDPKREIAANLLNIIMLCVSIIVVAIPEGLPLAVTLSLAFSIKKLMDNNNLVRKMHACETMGGANYICTDKTGTLTKNEMNVFKVLTATDEITLEETVEYQDAGKLGEKSLKKSEMKRRDDYHMYFKNEDYFNILKTAIAVNTDGQIKKLTVPNIQGDMEECETKNKTDKAFNEFLYRLRVKISEIKENYLSDTKYFRQIPFDSKRKRMTTYIKSNDLPTGHRLYVKGGAEKVAQICKYYLDPMTGQKMPMTEKEYDFIIKSIDKFNKKMLRSLYVAYKDIDYDAFENYSKKYNDLEQDQFDCVFIGCVGIRDSLRNGVKEAVQKCHRASVNVIMVTGDNIVTATAIAKDCEILGDDVGLDNLKNEDIEKISESNDTQAKVDYLLKYKPKALTGNSFYLAIGGLMCSTCGLDSNLCKCPKTEAEAKELVKGTNEEPKKIKNDTIKNKKAFYDLTRNLKVMARSQPIHKYSLVLGLKELDQVVAVTGDGTNDAPALSKSNVGFAMFAGTDIAKEASDIVILDNNFSSIVVAIIYGRNIYDNIRKFLQFQLTVNFCACLLVFICACIGNETPLTTIQMLWINLIMDSLGSLALATEPPYEELLNRPPTRKGESIISGIMWKHIAIQALVELALLIVLYLTAPYFIKEKNKIRLAEAAVIKACYGKLPGDTDLDKIIFGISPKWTNDVEILPEYEDECGSYGDRQDLKYAYKQYIEANSSTAHMTIVFNIFVIYTLFNQINCRVLDDSLNIFVRIHRNIFFPIITLAELALQVILIEFGEGAFKCIEWGLTAEQWGICIGFSAITFVLRIIIIFLPIDKPIQSWLDNSLKSNKVANEEDLVKMDVKHSTIISNNTLDVGVDNKPGNLTSTPIDPNSIQGRKRESFIQKLKFSKTFLKSGSSLSMIRKEKPIIQITPD